jgi:predicted alpha/beta hydrolase family esterase/8-oxo-dGTP pyrophosphatase MutT (NUDIX family)
MKTALIIHGAYGNPDENWFPWLKKELESLDYNVLVPNFPTPENQSLNAWMEVVEPYLSKLDKESVLVGHSIGAVFLLSILEKLEHPAATALFVSGFLHDLGDKNFDTINNSFYNKELDWEKIRNTARYIAVLHGDNDPYVPKSEAHNLAEKLDVQAAIIPEGGHLNADAGYVAFPELLEKAVEFDNRKALIIPINSDKQIFIQDRRGHKKPDWGYFGGEIEEGETPVEAVIRESKEELDVEIKPDELTSLGTSTTAWNGRKIIRYIHLYKTEQKTFNVLEGAGGHWMSFDEARGHFEDKDRFDEIVQRVEKVLGK